jgi:hypothetical protein
MKTEHSLAQLCATLEVTASGYHAWIKAQPSARAQQLAKQGQCHGIKRIARLMKQAGLRGLCPKRFVPRTTASDHDQPVTPTVWPLFLRPLVRIKSGSAT